MTAEPRAPRRLRGLGRGVRGPVDDLFSLQRRMAEGLSAALRSRSRAPDRERLARPPTAELSTPPRLLAGARAARAARRGRQPVARDREASRARSPGPRLRARPRRAGRGLLGAVPGDEGPSWPRGAPPTASPRRCGSIPTSPARASRWPPSTRARAAAEAAVDELRRAPRPPAVERRRPPAARGASWPTGPVGRGHRRAEDRGRPAAPVLAQPQPARPAPWSGSGRHAKPSSPYPRLADLQPDNPRAFQRLGTAYQRWATTTARSRTTAARIEPWRPTPWPTRTSARIHLRRGPFNEAAAAYEEAAGSSP